MRLLASVSCIALLSVARLSGQSPTLLVLRHTPGDTATPGNIIAVTFDRPVAGQLGATVDPARIFHLAPAIPGRVEWRDPVTIRFIPDQPIEPGTRIAVTVDTMFRAFDGTRLAKPYAFAFRVPGPRLLARSFGDDNTPGVPATLPLDGGIQLLYSAPVDFARLQSGARIELAAQCTGVARTVALRALRQRTVSRDDPWEFQEAGGWDRDTTGDRFRRVVELKPAQPLPSNCPGFVVLPNTTEDLAYGGMERFAIETAASFRLQPFDCSNSARCSTNDLVLRFTAPVKRADVLEHVRLEPALPLVLDAADVPSGEWRVKLALAPRTTYTVIADSTLRDVYGRALAGPRSPRFVTGDFVPTVSYPAGTPTMPLTGPRTLPVSHVNVRTMRVVSYRIPFADRARAFAAGPDGLERMLDSLP
ncbi:MAG TPA: Ig-like domain-containing protein, partial [Gemmatimonadaceae bacterium]|nr:Ig-like domain-containing protein [Gemmatimonadaceae bacterium]